jgi:magnesium chelatase family protein
MVCRALAAVRFPCRCQVLAATNPCPCGHHGNRLRACTCSTLERDRYRARLSGPLLDRLDIHLEIQAVAPEDLSHRPKGLDSAALRGMVLAAEAFRIRRAGQVPNADLSGRKLTESCSLGSAESDFLSRAAGRLGFSARSHDRILRVARTIADMDGSDRVGLAHLAEATAYRLPERAGPALREAARGGG